MNPLSESLLDAFKRLADVVVEPEEVDNYAQHMLDIYNAGVAVRLLERLPLESRSRIASLINSGQSQQATAMLTQNVDPEILKQIYEREMGEQTAEWVREITPHLPEDRIFKLRHVLTQL